MNELTDIELVELARNDNEEAKLELFRRCSDVLSYSIRKTKIRCYNLNEYDIEDVSSECALAVMEAIKLYNPSRGAAFKHFLKFVIRTKLYNYIETRIEQRTTFSLDSKEEELKIKEIAAPHKLEDLVRDLTIKVKNDRDKEIIELFLAGMLQTDIADEFKISKARVRQIIKECIK